jgi:hypothetical protein
MTARKTSHSTAIAVCTVSAIGSSHSGVTDDLSLLRCYAVSLGVNGPRYCLRLKGQSVQDLGVLDLHIKALLSFEANG